MLNARNVIIGSVTIFVLSIIINVISVVFPSDNNGLGRDSYGVHLYGYRGLYETIGQIDVPVSRSQNPFTGMLPTNCSYVLITPDIKLLESEKSYLLKLKKWVHSGGRLVVSFQYGKMPETFRKEFELDDIQIIYYDTQEPVSDSQEYQRGMSREEIDEVLEEYQNDREETPGEIPEDMQSLLFGQNLKRQTLFVKQDEPDKFSFSINSIKVHEQQLYAFDLSESEVSDIIYCLDEEGDNYNKDEMEKEDDEIEDGRRAISCTKTIGKGELCLISEPSLFENLSLRDSDNSILLVHLISEGRERVIFDEFFHGLSIRGNPIWLFAQPGYRLIIVAILFAVGVWVWREMISLGKLREPPLSNRRSLSTYLEAVAHLMSKTKRHQPVLKQFFKEATIWRAAHDLNLPLDRRQEEDVVKHLKRTHPELHDEFVSIMNEYNSSNQPKVNKKDLLKFLQRSQHWQF